ncbi:MAG: CopG family transcriptional regulator [Cyanobacteria bacterium J06635_1]
MHIATEFDEDHAGKLTYIQQQTNQDITDILNQAIDLYYQQFQPPEQSPLEIFQEAGLVGCIDADPDLSSNYKTILRDQMKEKHEQEQQQQQ